MENLIADSILEKREELEKRKQLAGRLEETLSLIAHGWKSHDPDFITKNQAKFEDEYGEVLERLRDSSEIDHVVVTYNRFKDLSANKGSGRIRKEAEEALIYMHSHGLPNDTSSC